VRRLWVKEIGEEWWEGSEVREKGEHIGKELALDKLLYTTVTWQMKERKDDDVSGLTD
jgi:hypothetical protein